MNVREYYSKDGELAPSSKGLSMGPEQWRTLVDSMEVRLLRGGQVRFRHARAGGRQGIKRINAGRGSLEGFPALMVSSRW